MSSIIPKKYNSSIALLRIIATIMVFTIHFNEIFLANFQYSGGIWIIENKFILNVSVPLFFMITGYIYRGVPISFKKAFSKILLFYFVSMMVSLFANICKATLLNKELISFCFVINEVKNALLMQWVTYLWFMPYMIALYLFIPVFSLLDKCSFCILGCVIILFGFIKQYIPIIKDINFSSPLPWNFAYYFLGGVFYELSKKQKVFALLAFLLILIPYAKYNLHSDFYTYPLLGTFLFASCIFLAVININFSNAVINKFSSFCFTIYLIHPFILHFILKKMRIPLNNSTYYLAMVCAFLCVSFVSIIVQKSIGCIYLKTIKKSILKLN